MTRSRRVRAPGIAILVWLSTQPVLAGDASVAASMPDGDGDLPSPHEMPDGDGDEPDVDVLVEGMPDGDGDLWLGRAMPEPERAASSAEAHQRSAREAAALSGLLATLHAERFDRAAGDSEAQEEPSRRLSTTPSRNDALRIDASSAWVVRGGAEVIRRSTAAVADIDALSGGERPFLAIGTKRMAKVRALPETRAMPAPQGELARSSASRTMSESRRALERCFRSALASRGNDRGKLVVNLVVDENGRVREAVVEDAEAGSDELAHCAHASLTGRRFAKPEGGPVRLTSSWVFAPADDAPAARP